MLPGKLVVLRAIEMADRDRYHRWLNDPEIVHLLGSMRYPFSLGEEERLLQERFTRQSPDYVNLAIDTREGVHIGSVSLDRVSKENRNAALGIFIGYKEYWGKGYGTDAVRTLLAFAFNEMNLHRVYLHTYEYNERATACYRKLGFVEEGRLRQQRYTQGRYWDEIVMGVLRDESPGSNQETEQASAH